MKTKIFLLLFLVVSAATYAQDSTEVKPEKDQRPIKYAFESSYHIDNYTTEIPKAKTLEFMIQHRFGTLNSENFDLAGLYAPSNIRIGLNYGITDNINIGLGTTKFNKLQDLNIRWGIIKQTRGGTIPVSVTYYGNVEYDMRDEGSFGIEFKDAHRFSYFHELMISRWFGPNLSIQISANYSHFNLIDTTELKDAQHTNFALSFTGRYKVAPTLGIVWLYNQTFTTPSEIQPGYGLGIQIGTSAHIFQVFVNSANAISRQRIQTENRNDLANNDILLGFNISRIWFF